MYLINPASLTPFLLTATTLFGILFHDSSVDMATVTAVATPAQIVSTNIADAGMAQGQEQHTHVETASGSQTIHDSISTQPRLQPRTEYDSDHRQKRFYISGDDDGIMWPSV